LENYFVNLFIFLVKETPIKLTITELFETPEAGQIVNCNLEIAEKESIIIRFGLNGDSPQDITNYLVSLSRHSKFVLLF
jgi:hypothetical protein